MRPSPSPFGSVALRLAVLELTHRDDLALGDRRATVRPAEMEIWVVCHRNRESTRGRSWNCLSGALNIGVADHRRKATGGKSSRRRRLMPSPVSLSYTSWFFDLGAGKLAPTLSMDERRVSEEQA
jgi:hypothetical protein